MTESKSWSDIQKLASSFKFNLEMPVNGEEPTEIMLMCGWWGAVSKHLQKYSNMIKNFRPNLAILIVVASDRIRSPIESYSKVADDAWTVLSELVAKRANMDTWLYYFSNGGCMVHQALLGRLGHGVGKPALEINLKGIIMDSAPALPTVRTLSRAINNGKDSWLFYAGALLLVGTASLLGFRSTFWKDMLNARLGIPELYIYSKTDRVTTFDSLDKLVDTRIENGVKAIKLVFDSGMHVLHYKEHPEAYELAVRNFMNDI